MNRREFIGSTIVVVGMMTVPLAASAKKWYEKDYYGPLTAEQFMTKAFLDYTRGTGRKHWPHEMVGSPQLYEDYSANLQCLQRWVSDNYQVPARPSLMYKAARFYKSDFKDNGWKLYIKDVKTGQYAYYDVSQFGWRVT